MAKCMTFVTFLGLCLTGAAEAQSVRFESKEGRFHATFPGKPEVSKQPVPGAAGKIVMTVVGVERPDGLFMVVYNDLTGDFSGKEVVDTLLDNARDGGVRGAKGTLLKELKIKQGDAPGREVTFSAPADGPKPALFHRQRIYLAGNRLYQAVVIGGEAKTKSKEAEAFFKSFAIVPVTADAAKTRTGRRPAAAAGPAPAPAAPTWTKYSYDQGPAGRFSVRFPAAPVQGEEPGLLGARKLVSFTSKDDTLTYIVQVQALPAKATAKGPGPALDATRDALLKSTGGKLLSERTSDFGDEGRRLEVKAGALMIRAHSCVRGNILYDLAVVGPGKDEVYGPDATTFFKSFSFKP